MNSVSEGFYVEVFAERVDRDYSPEVKACRFRVLVEVSGEDLFLRFVDYNLTCVFITFDFALEDDVGSFFEA